MTMELRSGFREVEHTADLSLHVWGDTIEALFSAAIKGLYYISRVSFSETSEFNDEKLNFEENDLESLLISFLSECNFRLQNENQALVIQNFKIDRCFLEISPHIYKIDHFEREIKAVTYHNLEIRKSINGYSVQIVFDV
ncbi:MAG TPA: archease [Anaerolineaceae bacterium]|nr:archease [Anaerolineaceae bacterium]